ncbi:MAG: NlpC/P60 family protein [Gammaproteobacteria bacterium]|nr:NlpC/P60 family protein [Gammaproteobacteria bacterium]
MYKLITVLCCGMLLMACSSAPYRSPQNSSVKIASQRVDFNNSTKVKRILNQQYNAWRHVNHRMGGLSKKGIDCSGLVYRTYRAKFGIDLPRSTEYQSQTGQHIKQSQLRPGDLVFFKTGFKTRHVGMYIEKGSFLHVSSSKGVMISSLHNPYWSRVYWKARRL